MVWRMSNSTLKQEQKMHKYCSYIDSLAIEFLLRVLEIYMFKLFLFPLKVHMQFDNFSPSTSYNAIVLYSTFNQHSHFSVAAIICYFASVYYIVGIVLQVLHFRGTNMHACTVLPSLIYICKCKSQSPRSCQSIPQIIYMDFIFMHVVEPGYWFSIFPALDVR